MFSTRVLYSHQFTFEQELKRWYVHLTPLLMFINYVWLQPKKLPDDYSLKGLYLTIETVSLVTLSSIWLF